MQGVPKDVGHIVTFVKRLFKNSGKMAIASTVGQDIFSDMIFSRISRILTKPRKYHVSEQELYDLITKKLY